MKGECRSCKGSGAHNTSYYSIILNRTVYDSGECAQCLGTGKAHKICPECGGAGEFYIGDYDDGHKWQEHYRDCKRCSGNGRVSVQPLTQEEMARVR